MPRHQVSLPGMERGPCHEDTGLGSGIDGAGRVAGVDEAGRGCLAGPVVSAAVILPDTWDLPGLDDSKKLTPKRREALAPRIRQQALSYAIAVAWPEEIDRINILQASLATMRRAICGLTLRPGHVAVDGNQEIPHLPLPQTTFVKGDGRVPCISAASVLAKTFRDAYMIRMAETYPGYGFECHKGYGSSKAHLTALEKLGPCALHRLSFAPLKAKAEQQCLPGM